MEKNFEKTVKAMSAKGIIMAMVEGLQNPSVMVNMDAYGLFINGVYYGCAATNTICKISGKIFNIENIENIGLRDYRAKFINSNSYFLASFEIAINELRSANIREYNDFAESGGFAKIRAPYYNKLPFLTDNYTTDDLQQYIDLANTQ